MKSKVFLRFIITYTLVLIIPVIFFGLFIYGRFEKILTDEVTNSTIDMLHQVRDIIDVRIQEISDITCLIERNPKISPFISDNSIAVNNIYPEVYDSINEFKNYKNSNSIIDHVFLYLKDNDIVISDMSKDSFNGVFEGSYIYKDMSGKTFHDMLVNAKGRMLKPSTEVRYGMSLRNNLINIITYINPLPINNTVYSSVLIITIKESMFQMLINNVSSEYKGSVYILDSNCNIITNTHLGVLDGKSEEYPQNIDFKKFGSLESYNGIEKNNIISYVKSKDTGWSYAAVIPVKQVFSKVIYVRYLSFAVIIGSLALGLGLAFLFSRSNYGKIKSITDLIGSYLHSDSTGNYVNEWELINRAFCKYINENEKLEQKLTEQIPVLKSNFLMRLLKGDFKKSEDIEDMINFLNIDLNRKNYFVLVLVADDYDKLISERIEPAREIITVAVSNAVEGICAQEGKAHAVETEKGRIAVIMGINQEKTEQILVIKDIGRKICTYVAENFDFTVSVGISDTHRNIMEISAAYNEACKAVGYKMVYGANSIIPYNGGLGRIRNKYFYSLKQENMIINYLRAGDFDSVKALIECIVAAVKNDEISIDVVKCVFLDIINTAFKACNELGIEEGVIEWDLPGLVKQETLDGLCKEIFKFYSYLCECVRNARNNKSDSMIKSAVDYINNNYNNKMLSVELIADELSISPSYLSKIFKDKVGYCFTDYVHSIRLARAKEMLSIPRMKVTEIADEVGYNSINNFVRVFKHYESITPTEYRINHVNEEIEKRSLNDLLT